MRIIRLLRDVKAKGTDWSTGTVLRVNDAEALRLVENEEATFYD